MRKLAIFALLAVSTALLGCGRKATPTAPDDPSGDRARLQGTWAIESFDDGDATGTEAERKRRLERIQQDRLTFDGNRLTIASPGGRATHLEFGLDATKDPKVMDVYEVRDFGPGSVGTFRGTYRGTYRTGTPRGTYRTGTARGTQANRTPGGLRREWIYKFDGDTLVIALSTSDSKRPTEFKARKWKFEKGQPEEPGVFVIRLKKTNTPAGGTPHGPGTARGRYDTRR